MKLEKLALSIALSASFLSAVADRFGLWGEAGQPGVVWGNYQAFLQYTQHLNQWSPAGFITTLGALATGIEIILPFFLISGFFRKEASLASTLILTSFALAMTLADGLKGPLDYSVFTALTASFLLYRLESLPSKLENQ